jgi:hypothetical protein
VEAARLFQRGALGLEGGVPDCLRELSRCYRVKDISEFPARQFSGYASNKAAMQRGRGAVR